MDLLFKRYASPFSLLDGYIQTSRFCEFLHGFFNQKAEDELWEYFLHKVWDKSFNDFREDVRSTKELQLMSEKQMEATVKKSMNILGNFNPTTQEEGDM